VWAKLPPPSATLTASFNSLLNSKLGHLYIDNKKETKISHIKSNRKEIKGTYVDADG